MCAKCKIKMINITNKFIWKCVNMEKKSKEETHQRKGSTTVSNKFG